jgi:hypothetical protein
MFGLSFVLIAGVLDLDPWTPYCGIGKAASVIFLHFLWLLTQPVVCRKRDHVAIYAVLRSDNYAYLLKYRASPISYQLWIIGAGWQEEISGISACKQKDIGHPRYAKLAHRLFPPSPQLWYVQIFTWQMCLPSIVYQGPNSDRREGGGPSSFNWRVCLLRRTATKVFAG